MAKALVAFYSRADENYCSGALKMLDVGNTEVVARRIAALTGAELFKIEQEKPYAKDYNTCIEEAKTDKERGARPALKAYPESLDGYDTVYLGFPNYWGTVPMAVCTFLEHFDLAGKVIRPFCTHEGSGMGSSVTDIKKLCPKAGVEGGLAIHGSSVAHAEKVIEGWVNEK